MNRKSNFELLRIVAMLMIVLLHANYFSLGAPSQEDIVLNPIASFWRILAEQLCIIGVNVYVLISGWFGIKPTTKGFCSLLYQVLFWGSIITIGGIAFSTNIPINLTARVFWFGSYYWFIISYIGLYVLSPLLNSFIESSSAKLYFAVLICFFATEFIYGWIIASDSYSGGYSIISFIGLYLLARFIRLHSKKLINIKPFYCVVLYLIMTLIPATISFIGIKNNWVQLHPLYYSSPFVIAGSTFFFLSFSKLEFNNRVINWIACSTFSVYIIHIHPIIVPYFKSAVSFLSDNYSVISYSIIVVLLSIALLLTSTILDKIRLYSWNLICSICLDKLFCRMEARFDRMIDKILH